MEEKIYNINKTEIINNPDLSLGKLIEEEEVIYHDAVIGQEEIGHYETVMEYPNGGKDVQWIIDQPFVQSSDAYEETIKYFIYIPYTETELRITEINNRINELKQEISATDYKTLKYVEGYFTEEEYLPIKTQRQSIRNEINSLEEELESLSK